MNEENHMNQEPAAVAAAGQVGEQNKQQTGTSFSDPDNVTKRSSKHSTAAPRVAGGELLGQAKGRLQTFKQDADDYVRKNPSKAVFIAVGIGFVLGLMRRR